MRVEQIMMFFPSLFHSFPDLLVGIGSSRNLGRDSGMRTFIQIEYTGKVARVAYVHGVSDGCDRWTRVVFACLQILVEYIVTVVGCNETFHG